MGIKIGDMVSDDMLASNMEDNTNLGLDDFNMDSPLSDPLSTDDGMGIGDNSLGGLEGFDTAGADFGLPDGMEFDDNRKKKAKVRRLTKVQLYLRNYTIIYLMH